MLDLLDHLDSRRKAWAAFIGGAILFLVEVGLQVSGYTNLPLALSIWGTALLLGVYWLHYILPQGLFKSLRSIMASWPFIIACFAVALLAVGAGGYGFGLRSMPGSAVRSPPPPPPVKEIVTAPSDVPKKIAAIEPQ